MHKRSLETIKAELKEAKAELRAKRQKVETLQEEQRDHPETIQATLLDDHNEHIPDKVVKQLIKEGRLTVFAVDYTKDSESFDVAAGCAQVSVDALDITVCVNGEEDIYGATRNTGQCWDGELCMSDELREQLNELTSCSKAWKRAVEWNKGDIGKTLAMLYFEDHKDWMWSG